MGNCEYFVLVLDTVTGRGMWKTVCCYEHTCICICNYDSNNSHAGEELLRLTKGEITTMCGGEVGWSSSLRVQVFCDECGSHCGIWCPSVMVDGLWASVALLTPHSSTQWIWCLLTVCHTAVTMDVGWWERGKMKDLEKVKIGSCIQLHYV